MPPVMPGSKLRIAARKATRRAALAFPMRTGRTVALIDTIPSLPFSRQRSTIGIWRAAFKSMERTDVLVIPDLDMVSAVFGNISHMPKYESIPDEFTRENNEFVRAV